MLAVTAQSFARSADPPVSRHDLDRIEDLLQQDRDRGLKEASRVLPLIFSTAPAKEMFYATMGSDFAPLGTEAFVRPWTVSSFITALVQCGTHAARQRDSTATKASFVLAARYTRLSTKPDSGPPPRVNVGTADRRVYLPGKERLFLALAPVTVGAEAIRNGLREIVRMEPKRASKLKRSCMLADRIMTTLRSYSGRQSRLLAGGKNVEADKLVQREIGELNRQLNLLSAALEEEMTRL
jgi:hypothetical protein